VSPKEGSSRSLRPHLLPPSTSIIPNPLVKLAVNASAARERYCPNFTCRGSLDRHYPSGGHFCGRRHQMIGCSQRGSSLDEECCCCFCFVHARNHDAAGRERTIELATAEASCHDVGSGAQSPSTAYGIPPRGQKTHRLEMFVVSKPIRRGAVARSGRSMNSCQSALMHLSSQCKI
jgi:hypothetical protein